MVVSRETWPDSDPFSLSSAFEAGVASSPVPLLSSCVALDRSLKPFEAELQFAT